ncbi:hypothetical protein HO173_000027 [Letharia columbiana]|uniref:Uncharacterized protein n=1 Tax=Letharia columbiana TaxID=112416 RepID=A0A8H6LA92_9LECA|nr:uncharacterized protein HO173_000027 [Letharia columbiana]KAF6241317.1 hypothetical protein HO173_000027 [Letharia columbiana]
MATIPPYKPSTKHSAKTTIPPDDPEAEYETAVAAYKAQVSVMGPTRKQYEALFFQHKQAQTRYDKIMDKTTSQNTTYQRHKRYVISLTNALLASNLTLRSASGPVSDLQALTHATLLYDIRLSARTLVDMMVQNKRLDKARERFWKLDQELHVKCEELFEVVDKNCKELDRLHAKVLEAEKKMGEESRCGMAEGKCLSCVRNSEKEARRLGADDVAKAKGGPGKIGKGLGAKKKLEDILEEVD